MVLASCNKASYVDKNEIEGIYVGSYTTTNLTRGFSWTTTPTIELKEGKYSYQEDPFEGWFLVNHSGNYSISNKKIIFEVTNDVSSTMEIHFAEGYALWYLGGEYNYTFDGEKLLFSKVISSPTEEYRVEFEFHKQ